MISTVGYEGNALVHHCHCGRWGAFGFDVSLREGKLGKWYCGEHRPDKSDGAQAPIIVTLADVWKAKAIEVGKARQAYAVANNLRRIGKSLDNPEIFHISGAMAEVGTAKHYRLRWLANVGNTHGVDVGGIIEVRSSTVPSYNLGIRPKDHDDRPYVFAIVHLADYRVELRGWLWGREGKGNPDIWDEECGCWFNRPPYRPLYELEALVPKLLAAVKP